MTPSQLIILKRTLLPKQVTQIKSIKVCSLESSSWKGTNWGIKSTIKLSPCPRQSCQQNGGDQHRPGLDNKVIVCGPPSASQVLRQVLCSFRSVESLEGLIGYEGWGNQGAEGKVTETEWWYQNLKSCWLYSEFCSSGEEIVVCKRILRLFVMNQRRVKCGPYGLKRKKAQEGKQLELHPEERVGFWITGPCEQKHRIFIYCKVCLLFRFALTNEKILFPTTYPYNPIVSENVVHQKYM